MSIRISTLSHPTCPSTTALNNGKKYPFSAFTSPFPLSYGPLNDLVMQYREAAPFYASIAVRLRIAGGPNNGYDGTATWNRAAMAFTGSPVTAGDGLDIMELATLSAGNCYALVGADMSDYSNSYPIYRDPKKQRVFFIGEGQSINGGPATLPIGLPMWGTDSASTDQRVSIRYWGFSGSTATAVDSDTFSATKWRDLRGSYSETATSGGVTYQYDWTIA